MASIDEIREARLAKLRTLEERGINPYPTSVKLDKTLKEAAEEFKEGENLTLAGRIMAIRGQGKIVFCDLDDGTGKFQVLLKDNETREFEIFSEYFDIGDFMEVKGRLFLTKQNEKTIQAESFRMLAKSLRPLPEKWHGLQDIEERFRRRYLDLVASPEVRERFKTRSRVIALIRDFYIKNDYLEVDLPNLQPLAGGATAAPFKTHHNALGMDFFLPVAQELYLKELLSGGIPRVFELGKRFRNEGIDTSHNPEFTMLESNAAYEDAKVQRKFIEKLMRFVVKKLFGGTTFEYQGQVIDVGPKFRVFKYFDLLKEAGVEHPQKLDAKTLDRFYKDKVRDALIQPTFIVDYPVDANPFAKRKDTNSKLIDRFQLVVAGTEIVNAFSELNNPIDQRERYKAEDAKALGGEKEISPSDLEYLEAMEYGMPPNGGIGIGIDRLVMLLTNVTNIKEVILFPTLKPRN